MRTRATGRGAHLTSALFLVLLLSVALVAIAGCSKAEPVAPAEEGPKLASSSAKVTGELDPGHPEGLPLWEGATVASSVLISDAVYELSITTADAYDDVVYGVGSGLEGEGFTVEALDESPEVTILMAIKGDLAALYTIAPAETGAGTTIGISAQLPAQ